MLLSLGRALLVFGSSRWELNCEGTGSLGVLGATGGVLGYVLARVRRGQPTVVVASYASAWVFGLGDAYDATTVSYTHLTLPTIYSV